MAKRGKILSNYEMGVIDGMYNLQESISNIAKKLNRSYGWIKKYLMRMMPYKLSGGPHKKLSTRKMRHISRLMVNNPKLSGSRIIKILKLNVSDQTVYNFLSFSDWKYLSAKKAPFLTKIHKLKRLTWARNLISQMCRQEVNLNKIPFVDEKRFLLDGPDTYRY